MNEPEPPDFERTLPARPPQTPKQEEAEPADLERTMPARDPRSSDDLEMADLEKTFVPPTSIPPPAPAPAPAIPHSGASPHPQRGSLIPPAFQSQPPVIPTSAAASAPGKNKTIWIVTGCVGCGLLALILAAVAMAAYFAWQRSSDRQDVLLAPPVPVTETVAPGPGERTALSPKPGSIVGHARFEDGRPVPLFRVSAVASDGPLNAFAREAAGANLAEVEGRDGRYELPAGDSAAQNKAGRAKAIVVRAVAKIAYRARNYEIAMHPTQSDVTLLNGVDSHGDDRHAVVRDFVLKMSGVRPGYDGRVARETTSQDKPANAFYGGTVHLDLTYSEGTSYGAELARTTVDAKIAITLTPAGPLLDGSSGRPIVREIRPAAGQTNFYFHLHSIPIGLYTATAHRIDPNGGATPLRLSTAPRGYQLSASVDFAPARTSLPSGVEDVTLFLVK